MAAVLNKINFQASYKLYKRMWSYMSEYWQRFIISILAMIVAAATEPAFARIMKPLIDNGFIDQDQRAIILTPLAVMGIFLIRAIASYLNDYLTNWLSGSIVEKMRRIMFNRLLKLPVQYYDDNNSGRIMSRIIFDVTQITEAGFNVVTVTFKDGVTVVALLGLLFYTDWQLTLFCFFTLPFVLILVRVLAHRLRKLSHHNQQQYGEMTQIITEAVQGQKVVKLFGGKAYETKRFNHSVSSIKTNNVKQAATASLNSGVSQFLVACALGMILYFAASKSKSNHFTAGDFVSFITAMIMIFAPIKRITSVTQSLQKGLTAAESVFEFLDNSEEPNYGTIELTKVKNSICFKNVTFKYHTSERDIIHNVSFEVKVGEVVALVGSSGSGKTTIANLIPRFYNINQGEILIDDINLIDFELHSLREHIALVSQDVVLFNDTIYNNIAYGLDAINMSDKVVEAAKLANALEFIEQLPDGFSTYIGENGTRLSGGQKQRIAIARAILKNAPILILDEATSALDNQSEKLVQEALDRLMRQRTTVVIAHRLSTVLHADKIVVMEQGEIVETGRHEELLVKGGVYARLYKVQANGGIQRIIAPNYP
ncbi:MAG: lipid A export permease/ATP-binding protein MsbA, partial [Burkholderiales bacterium]|nr:lipid A export permease/ATP-binding protein MsbA [Burkholderiales bacterium]